MNRPKTSNKQRKHDLMTNPLFLTNFDLKMAYKHLKIGIFQKIKKV